MMNRKNVLNNISLIIHYIQEFKANNPDPVFDVDWMIHNLRQLVTQCRLAEVDGNVIYSFEHRIELLRRQIEDKASDATLYAAIIQSQKVVTDSKQFIK